MASKYQLREQREGTIINHVSKVQEVKLSNVIALVIEELRTEFPGIRLEIKRQWFLKDIVRGT